MLIESLIHNQYLPIHELNAYVIKYKRPLFTYPQTEKMFLDSNIYLCLRLSALSTKPRLFSLHLLIRHSLPKWAIVFSLIDERPLPQLVPLLLASVGTQAELIYTIQC